MVVVGVMIAVEEAGEEDLVADADVWVALGVVIGAVDLSFVVVCVVEVAGFAVVVSVYVEAAKFKQKANSIKWFSQTNAD